jgi:hypothetical protein
MNLQQVFEELGYETRSYSGRGMFGKSCLGVEISNDDNLFSLGIEVGEFLTEDNVGVNLIPRACTDSLGRGTILYFPDVEYKESEKENEEEYEDELDD